MTKTKLSKKQLEVMDGISSAESEEDVLRKTKISPELYRKWTMEVLWQEEFEERLEGCRRQAQLIIANYMLVAASKLVSLTDCEKETTARQACLDILQMKPLIETKVQEKTPEQLKVNDKKAREIMKILAGKTEDEEET